MVARHQAYTKSFSDQRIQTELKLHESVRVKDVICTACLIKAYLFVLLCSHRMG